MTARKYATPADVELIVRKVLAEFAPEPAKAAPAKAEAKAPTQFVQDMRARAAAKVPCPMHPAEKCNRRFSPTSAGLNDHLARIV